MTENCFKVSKPSMENHSKIFTKEEVSEIYNESI